MPQARSNEVLDAHGVAFTNKDSSITIQLDALPVSGRLQIRDAEERDDRDERNDRRERR